MKRPRTAAARNDGVIEGLGRRGADLQRVDPLAWRAWDDQVPETGKADEQNPRCCLAAEEGPPS